MSHDDGDFNIPSLLSLCVCAIATTHAHGWETAAAVALCTVADTGIESATEELAAWWWWLHKRRAISVEPILRHAAAFDALVAEVKYEFDHTLHLIGGLGARCAETKAISDKLQETHWKIKQKVDRSGDTTIDVA